MAGCKPEYFPVVLAALSALTDQRFNLYGVQATTEPDGPMIVVNGPIRNEIGMNSGYITAWARETVPMLPSVGRCASASSTLGAVVPVILTVLLSGLSWKIYLLLC